MKRILVADDQASSRELIRTILECEGYEVTDAADGEEAFQKAQTGKFDLIILDLQMPKLDGIGVVTRLRETSEFGGVPIVAFTASAMQGDRERILQAGFSSYISKPISLPAFRSELARLLQFKSQC